MKVSRIVKFVFVFSLLVTLLINGFQGNPRVDAATIKTAFVNTKNESSLTVRNGAGTKYKAVGSLKSGVSVNVYSQISSGWSEIRFNSKKAYVSTKYLKFYTGVKVITHNYKEIKDLQYAQVTGLKNKSAENKINKVLSDDAKSSYKNSLKIKEQAKKDKKNGACQSTTCDYEYVASFKVIYNDGSKLSIFYHDYQYNGGAHGNAFAEAFNFDVTTGKRVKINDILTSKTKLSKVQKYAYKYMKNNKSADFFEDNKLTDVKINNNSQFYYTLNGIQLVFQEYEVGPYSAGNPTVPIPYSVFK